MIRDEYDLEKRQIESSCAASQGSNLEVLNGIETYDQVISALADALFIQHNINNDKDFNVLKADLSQLLDKIVHEGMLIQLKALYARYKGSK